MIGYLPGQIFKRENFRIFLEIGPVTDPISIEVGGKPVSIEPGWRFKLQARDGETFLLETTFFITDAEHAKGETDELTEKIKTHRNLLICTAVSRGMVKESDFSKEELVW